MRTMPLLFSLSLFALSGCASHPGSHSDKTSPSDYYWHLVSINERPATPVEARTRIHFTEGRIQVSGLCNTLGGRAVFNGERLSISQMISTLKACNNNELMTHEQTLSAWLPQVQSWSITHGETHPLLKLNKSTNDFIRLRGEPTPEHLYGSSGEVMFLEIQPKKASCNHPLIPNYQCLRVRSVTYSEQGIKTTQGEWENFYDDIQGYNHNENTRVILRIKRYPISNPPADASAYAYIHDLTVEQELITP